MPAILFIVFCGAVLTITSAYQGRTWSHYIAKPTTTLIILLIALNAHHPPSNTYQTLIVVGLGFSMLGDIFLMLPQDRFLQGLVSFLVAHILYIVAFWGERGSAEYLLAVVPIIALAGVVLWRLYPHLGEFRIPVLVYVAVIGTMGWIALARALGAESDAAWLAAIGAILFMVSDSVLALDRFAKPFFAARALVLGTYYAAQTLIALSV